MCNTCYRRGYNDYPKWVGSEHHDSYKKGFEARQQEIGGSHGPVESVDFCPRCYSRGKHDGKKGVWAPPEQGGGHYQSYEKGYKNA